MNKYIIKVINNAFSIICNETVISSHTTYSEALMIRSKYYYGDQVYIAANL